MHNRKQKRGAWLAASLHSHFSLWLHSMRTILMLIFMLMIAYMLTRSTAQSMAAKGYQVHLGEIVFSYADKGFNMVVMSVAVLVMFSEFPRQTAFQNYAVMRLSRVKWMISLVVFLGIIMFAFVVLMLAFSAMFSLGFTTPGGGWSDLTRLAEDPHYANVIPLAEEYIRTLNPAAACVLAAAILYLFWVTLSLLLLLFSLCNRPGAGLMLCISIPLLSITVLHESVGLRMPSHFSTLRSIASQVYENKFQYIAKCIAGYFVLNVLLIALIVHRVKRMDVRFAEKE